MNTANKTKIKRLVAAAVAAAAAPVLLFASAGTAHACGSGTSYENGYDLGRGADFLPVRLRSSVEPGPVRARYPRWPERRDATSSDRALVVFTGVEARRATTTMGGSKGGA